ncbi:ATP-binding cassette domain-containing protein [Pseudonocardia sp. ICBG1293]|uniref:ATP-binding cassette domain-containing protein n=1 Tax=Pseudonocardia sp. ICBG1293 TaxID=2844382 RepID=UPI001CD02C67|nr:ATP-binding cassette domain-containing protein [Pseudonocardia sp. ICBG1293]
MTSSAPTSVPVPDTALTAEGVAVDGAHGVLLAPTSLRAVPGSVLLVAGSPGSGHTALALALAGRMRPDHGTVTLDGDDDPRRLRRAVAVVDTPGVSEPEPVLPLRTVVGEELAMAGRGTTPRAVAEWLGARGAQTWVRSRFEDVPAAVRIGLMTALAASRPGIRVLVLTAPDRHGGTPVTWWQVASEHARAGFAVVVTCTEGSAALLGVPAVRLGGGDPGAVTEPPGRHARPDDPTGPLTVVAPQGPPELPEGWTRRLLRRRPSPAAEPRPEPPPTPSPSPSPSTDTDTDTDTEQAGTDPEDAGTAILPGGEPEPPDGGTDSTSTPDSTGSTGTTDGTERTS